MSRTAKLPSLWSSAAALASGTALALGLAWAVTGLDGNGDSRPQASPGDVFSAPYAEEPLPHEVRLELPWRHLDVAVGVAQPRLPDIGGAPADVAPPEGGSFVRVDVTSPVDQVPFVGIRRPLATQVEVSVRADGVDHPLSDRPGGIRLDPETPWTTATGTRWVAVDGSPTDVKLVVTVDGEEQVVDTNGDVDLSRGAQLADLPAATALQDEPEIDCGRSRRADSSDLELEDYSRDAACTVTRVLRVPYVDGLGWAPRGREYVAVLLTLDRSVQVERTGDDSWRSTTTLASRLGDDEPLAGPIDVNELNAGTLAIQDPDDPQMFVFEVDEGESPDLEATLDVEAVPSDPFATGRETLRLAWHVEGGRLS